MADLIIENKVENIVEIGCGDFHVTNLMLSFLDERNYNYLYVGYDVVKLLIKRNRELYGRSNIKFISKDACTGNIKQGDLLIIRQVLQHLNNNSIQQIINKFGGYRLISVTEHQASKKYGNLITPNLDKPTDEGIRLNIKSGVYLEEEPFNCTIKKYIYEIPQRIFRTEASINTFLITG